MADNNAPYDPPYKAPDINSPEGIRNRNMTANLPDLNERMRQQNRNSRDTDNSASQDKFGNPAWNHNGPNTTTQYRGGGQDSR